MELYVIRHGQTVWNAEGRLQGCIDVELNDNGRELARQTGIKFADINFDRVYSSPLKRAYETASLIVGERNIPIITDERIREISFGCLEGHSVGEFFKDGCSYANFFIKPGSYIPPEGGETFEQVIARTGDFYRNVIMPLNDTCERIMVVAHGNANKGFIYNLEDTDSIDKYWGEGLQANCEADIYVSELKDGKLIWQRKPGTKPVIDKHWGKAAKC